MAFVNIILSDGEPPAEKLLHVEPVSFVVIGQVFVLRVFGDVELVTEKGPDALHLQNALAAVHDGQLIHIHEGLAQLLIVQRVGGLPAPAFSGVEGVNSLLPQRLGQLFEGATLLAAQEQDTGAVSDDGFSVVLINGFQLALGLHHDVSGYLTGADHADEVLEVGDFLICEFIQQTGDVGFQRPAVLQGLVAQHVKHLRVDHSRDEIEGHVRVGYDAEQGRLAVPDLVQLQFIPFHQLPNLFDVERGHASTATYQDGFCGLSCDELSRTF